MCPAAHYFYKDFWCNEAWVPVLVSRKGCGHGEENAASGLFPLCFPAHLAAMFWAHRQFCVLISVCGGRWNLLPTRILTDRLHIICGRSGFQLKLNNLALCEMCCPRISYVFPAPWPTKLRCLKRTGPLSWTIGPVCAMWKEVLLGKNLLETAIIRNGGWAEETADLKDGLEESTPASPPSALQGVVFVYSWFVRGFFSLSLFSKYGLFVEVSSSKGFWGFWGGGGGSLKLRQKNPDGWQW